MEFTTHGNGNGLDDLYILPGNDVERTKVLGFVKSKELRYEWAYGDVEGSIWYRQRFIIIPFGECYQEEISLL